MPFLKYLLIIAIGYLCGNFNTGLIVSKAQSGIDIRKHGSGNAGATNMLRVLGSQPALLTIVGDILKGILAILIGRWIAGDYGGIAGGTAAIIGHDWPVFFEFKGGKGAATTIGVLGFLFPLHGLCCILVFLAIFVLTRYVSLGSMGAALFGAVMLCVTEWGDAAACCAGVLWCLLIIFCHRANILRLFAGTENRLDLSKIRRKQR